MISLLEFIIENLKRSEEEGYEHGVIEMFNIPKHKQEKVFRKVLGILSDHGVKYSLYGEIWEEGAVPNFALEGGQAISITPFEGVVRNLRFVLTDLSRKIRNTTFCVRVGEVPVVAKNGKIL